jgi:hypothetical protein
MPSPRTQLLMNQQCPQDWEVAEQQAVQQCRRAEGLQQELDAAAVSAEHLAAGYHPVCLLAGQGTLFCAWACVQLGACCCSGPAASARVVLLALGLSQAAAINHQSNVW